MRARCSIPRSVSLVVIALLASLLAPGGSGAGTVRTQPDRLVSWPAQDRWAFRPRMTGQEWPCRVAAIATRALLPDRARDPQVRRIPRGDGTPPRLIMEWTQGRWRSMRHLASGPERVLVVWEPSRRVGSGLCFWRRVFGLHERHRRHIPVSFSLPNGRTVSYHNTGMQVAVGRPNSPRIEQVTSGMVGSFWQFDSGDVTGDGRADLLLFEGGWGSGGVGIWRVISDHRGGMHQVFRRVMGDANMSLVPGHIEVNRPRNGPRCSIHGCDGPWRRTLLQWNGQHHWVPVSRTLVPH